MPRVLIVAYGNPLRCDDGVAWRAADSLQEKLAGSDVEILRLHQLAPEVADAVRNRELVLFLDAACVDDNENARPGEIRVCELSAAEIHDRAPGQFFHAYSPAKVMDLASELYQAKPKAFVITVSGEKFAHGDSLSPTVAAALTSLIGQIESMVGPFRK